MSNSQDYKPVIRNRSAASKKLSDIEHQLQVAQLDWCEWQGLAWPELNSIYAVPNQGLRSIPGYKRMKAEGLKTGQWDLCLPVPRRGFGALYIENKRPFGTGSTDAKLSPDQIKRGHILEEAGNLCYVIREIDHFLTLVTWYLQREDPSNPGLFHRGELWEYVDGVAE